MAVFQQFSFCWIYRSFESVLVFLTSEIAMADFFEVEKANVKGTVINTTEVTGHYKVLIVEDIHGKRHTITSDPQATVVNIGDKINMVDGMRVGD